MSQKRTRDAVGELLGSKKALVVMGAVGAVTFLAARHQVEGDKALEFIKWVLMTWLGAQAIQDGAKNLRSNGNGAAPLPPDPPSS